MAAPRFRMRLCLDEQHVERIQGCRNLSVDDIPALGRLMLEAYRDTIDYQGEDLDDAVEEVRGTIDGKYGPFLRDCSFVIENDDRVQAASLVTWSEDRKTPLLTYSMTHPDVQRRGMATLLIKKSIDALLARGHQDLLLVVTEGNVPARRLYEKLGFRVCR